MPIIPGARASPPLSVSPSCLTDARLHVVVPRRSVHLRLEGGAKGEGAVGGGRGSHWVPTGGGGEKKKEAVPPGARGVVWERAKARARGANGGGALVERNETTERE